MEFEAKRLYVLSRFISSSISGKRVPEVLGFLNLNMEAMTLLCALVALAVALLLLLDHLWLARSNLPPGPGRALPLIGHAHLLGNAPHRTMQNFSHIYGPLLFLKLFTVPTIVASSPEMAKEVLRTHDSVLSSRPYSLIGEYICYGFKDIAFAPVGEHWKTMRRICLTQLFTAKRIESFRQVRTEELSKFLSQLLLAASSKSDAVIGVKNYVTEYSTNVISRMLISKPLFGPNSEGAGEFLEIHEEVLRVLGKFNLSEYIPLAFKWIDWRKILIAKRLFLRQDKIFQKIIDEHRVATLTRDTEDFTDVLVSCFENEGSKQDDAVKALLMELIPAGTNLMTTTVEWALAELVQNTRVLKKAQQELDTVVGHERMVRESDLPNLQYLNAVIKEAFRLHPPASLLLPHSATHACKIAGYVVPKGCLVFVNVYAIGRDPSVWSDPLEFFPERFLETSLDLRGQDFELLPFGSGRRGCPGIPLGLKNIQMVLASMIHGFEWRLPPGEESHSMEECFGGVNSMQVPLGLVLAPRFLPRVYSNV